MGQLGHWEGLSEADADSEALMSAVEMTIGPGRLPAVLWQEISTFSLLDVRLVVLLLCPGRAKELSLPISVTPLMILATTV
jgi:hypothetical protein